MSVLVSLVQWTAVLYLMVSMTESRNNYGVVRTPYQELFLSQLQGYLSLIQFDTRDECVKAMCAQRKPRKLDQWLTFSDRGDLLSVGYPFTSPATRPVAAAFNDLRNVLKSGSYFITDGENNAIGVTADPGGDGNSNGSKIPPSVDPYAPPSYVGSTGEDHYLSIPSNYPPPSTERPLKPSVPSSETNVCCSTIESYFINSTLVDLTGTTRTVAQMKHIGTYQIIRHGFCGRRGVCPGICDQVYVILPLAIYPNDPGQIVTYRYFQIPGYCSCKVPA